MRINDQGTFYVEGEYKTGETILTAGDWELVADVDGPKKYAVGYEPDDFPELWMSPTLGSDWSDNGDGSYTLTGSGSYSAIDVTIPSTNMPIVVVFQYTTDGLIGVRRNDSTTGVSPGSFEAGSGIAEVLVTGNTSKIGIARVLSSVVVNATISNISVKLAHPKAGDTIQLGNGHHKDFRYYPYKLSDAEITELTR